MTSKYVHSEEAHNLRAPEIIVPHLIQLFHPENVIDVGCGLGTFLYVFKQYGVKDVLGLDGPWVNKKLRRKYLAENEFMECNLEEPINLHRKFDLVISLEVAEHLSSSSADVFVNNLVSAGNIILFSAAIPFQGGQNHKNEQRLSYWSEKFSRHRYVVHDIIRPVFWNNPNVFWWYKQNMVIVTPKEFILDPQWVYNPLLDVVHYDLFSEKAHRLEALYRGELPPLQYIKFFLKSLWRKRR